MPFPIQPEGLVMHAVQEPTLLQLHMQAYE